MGDASPFIKWAGGKGRLVHTLVELAPKRFGRYFEPFWGGGAPYWHLEGLGLARGAVLNDSSWELMTAAAAIRDDVGAVIAALQRHVDRRAVIERTVPADAVDRAELVELGYREHFLATRALDRKRFAPADVAAWMIFLNRTCYNGLWRVNRQDEFNTAFGDYDNPRIIDADNLRAVARALQGATLENRDFAEVCGVRTGLLPSTYLGPWPEYGDFVYFDPPYLPTEPGKSAFTAYTPQGFTHADHVRLAHVFRELVKRGVHVVASNSASAETRRLYEGFRMEGVDRSGNMSCKGDGRQPVAELLIVGGTW